MFRTCALPAVDNPFAALLASAPLEDVGKGRQGNVLCKRDEGGDIPIVRTTTRYQVPAQEFRAIHEELAQQLRRSAAITASFNHALIERYTNAYTNMKSHSDQALDLADDSMIAVFSCYKHPHAPSRRLIVEPKDPRGAAFEIPLAHNGVVFFSVATNRRFRHKIVLSADAAENEWLGITFRTAKTWVRILDALPRLRDGAPLTLADDAQRREFYKLRRRENDEADFIYPPISYTLSESDLRPPAPA